MTSLHRPGHSIISGRSLVSMRRWLPEALRATLLCMDGSTAAVTIHADERALIREPRTLRAIWTRAWRTSRAEIAAKDRPDIERARITASNDRIYSRPPVAVLCIRPWAEVK